MSTSRRDIRKFSLQRGVPLSEVGMPVGAQIMSVAWQPAGVFLWALVDPDQEMLQRRFFCVFCTNDQIGDARLLAFVGTIQVYEKGSLTEEHVFEFLPG